ncbi:hypothetical protein SAMN05216243_1843 [Sediminibacillus albus]|uniref:Uncharacterized protein n=1 Tax=Sediminibacillus albus TaxID=407036 RepID=A0A1G8YUY5_9BACI|nr:hypothetical protein SAMN05216243_1843 [Sediminibacillus albus]
MIERDSTIPCAEYLIKTVNKGSVESVLFFEIVHKK